MADPRHHRRCRHRASRRGAWGGCGCRSRQGSVRSGAARCPGGMAARSQPRPRVGGSAGMSAERPCAVDDATRGAAAEPGPCAGRPDGADPGRCRAWPSAVHTSLAGLRLDRRGKPSHRGRCQLRRRDQRFAAAGGPAARLHARRVRTRPRDGPPSRTRRAHGRHRDSVSGAGRREIGASVATPVDGSCPATPVWPRWCDSRPHRSRAT